MAVNAVTMENPKTARPLTPSQQLAMSLRFQNKTSKQIGEAIGKSPSTVEHWFARDGQLFDAYIAYCNSVLTPAVPTTHNEARSVAETLKSAAPAALEQVIALSNGAKREQVKLSASQDILDRAGYMPIQKMLNVHMVEELSIDQLDTYVLGILGKTAEKTPVYSPVEAHEIPGPIDSQPELGRADADAVDAGTPGVPIYKEGRKDAGGAGGENADDVYGDTHTPDTPETITVPDLSSLEERLSSVIDEPEPGDGGHRDLEGG